MNVSRDEVEGGEYRDQSRRKRIKWTKEPVKKCVV